MLPFAEAADDVPPFDLDDGLTQASEQLSDEEYSASPSEPEEEEEDEEDEFVDDYDDAFEDEAPEEGDLPF